MAYNIEEIDILGYRSSKTFQSSSSTSKYKITINNKRFGSYIYDAIRNILIKTFLPINYKKTVRSEYLQYQYYDSIQGLCSYVRGVITIRAVLVGAGVGNFNKTATSAALAWAFKDGIAAIGTLYISYTYSNSFEVYVKEYRLFADVLNNIALTIDLANSFLRFFTNDEFHYALLLAISSLFKCACGLIAGATKARISSHFARDGALADVNAKESSQETAVALVGIFVGSCLTKIFGDSDFDNIFIFIALTAIHMWANYNLVQTLVFDTMNPQRCWLIAKSMIETKSIVVLPPVEIMKKESLLLPFYLSYFGPQVGVSIQKILDTLDYIKNVPPIKSSSSSKKILEVNLKNLLDAFKEEHFVIGIDKNERVVICISNTANSDNILRSYMMSCFLHQTWHQQKSAKLNTKFDRIANLYSILINTDAKRASNWYNHIIGSNQKVSKQNIAFAGWDLSFCKLGEDSLRYRNKVMRSSMSQPVITQTSSNLESKNVTFANKVELNENVGLKRNVSYSDLEIHDGKSESENPEDSQSSTVTDLLLTYTGTNLVLDLFGPVSPSKKDDDTWRDSTFEENFSKGEGALK